MAEIIRFPGSKKPTSTEKPAGMVDVYAEGPDMVQLDGCIPVALMPAIMALCNTAGVAITQNV